MMRPEAERLVRANLRKAKRLAERADRYTEQASMAADAAFRTLEHGARMGSTEESRADKAYKAHSRLSDARGNLGSAVSQLESASRTSSRDARRRRRR